MKKTFLNIIRKLIKNKVIEKLLIPFTIYKPYGNVISKLLPRNTDYKKNTSRGIVKRDEISYKVDNLNELHDWYLYYGFKDFNKELLYSLIETHYNVIDVGANIGEFSLNFAKRINETNKVFSFEPFPKTFEKLQSNISLNKSLQKKILLFNIALSDREEEVYIDILDESNLGKNSITKKPNVSALKLETNKIDNFNINDPIHLIKVDIEGYELKFLKGAYNLIEKNKPMLFIELDSVNLSRHQCSSKDVIVYLKKFNYKIFELKNNKLFELDDDISSNHCDVLCLQLDLINKIENIVIKK